MDTSSRPGVKICSAGPALNRACSFICDKILRNMGFVAGPVIQATEKLEFEDSSG